MRGVQIRRREALGGLLLGGLALVSCGDPPTAGLPPAGDGLSVEAQLAGLEARFGGRLGVHALDTGSGTTVSHRADDRFLLCSTGKALTVGAILRRATEEPRLLERRIRWSAEQIAGGNSPFGRSALATGATVDELCHAAITISDNTAQNRLLELLGGPSEMTNFVRGLGDSSTRYDRFEPELNTTTPGDERDTTTPAEVVNDLGALTVGDVLSAEMRERLVTLMVANTTGAAQIRAGVPAGWQVADKTGSGQQGESNDVGLVWPPGRAPIVLAIYTAPNNPANKGGQAAIATATQAVLDTLTH